jgi:DNA-directed RNA polymerase subunit RPC12/RpoP
MTEKQTKVKFYLYGANGTVDPRHREGSGQKCAYCGHEFSYWDDLQISPNDRALKCASCKNIRIQLIRK